MKYSAKNPIGTGPKAPGGLPAVTGGDKFISQARGFINDFRAMIKMVQELRGMSQEFNQGNPDREINQDRPPPGGNPGLNKFLAKYGDTTIEQALEILKPMTIKQVLGMMQHGNRPGE